jgi:acetolactate synthase-1/2/3 large subunit
LGNRSEPSASKWRLSETAEWTRRFSASPPVRETDQRIAGFAPRAFYSFLQESLPRDAVLVTDSGLHQMLVRRYYEVRSCRGLVFPTDFQSMGFGIPAAIGAKLACPHRTVVLIVGDGGFAINGLELSTAVRDRIPILALVMNDGYLGLIRSQQLRELGTAAGVRIPTLDFRRLAESIGARYALASDDLEKVVWDAMSADLPTIVEVPVRDTWGASKTKAVGAARAGLRRVVGQRITAWLKHWFD